MVRKNDDPPKPLWLAVANRDAGAVALALTAGADPNGTDDEGLPVLLHATDTGEVALVVALLDAGAAIEMVDSLGYSPLMSAVASGSLELVNVLLARGADANARATSDLEGGPTPLALATENASRAAIVDALLAAGADPNRPRIDGWTPLMLAAHTGDVRTLEALLARGADPNAWKGEEHTTAADVALHRGHDAALAILRAAGAPDPTTTIAAQIADHWRAIDAWLQLHAVPCHDQLARLAGADEPAIAALEQTLGEPLPADLRAHLLLYGAAGGAPFYEYEGLGVAGIADRWRGLEQLRDRFAANEPREIDASETRVRRTWWHAGWIPFAQDGGGNLHCVDLAPGPHGVRGQVIGWEVHGGPTRPIAPSFEAFLRDFRDALVGSRLRYDASSGIFEPVGS